MSVVCVSTGASCGTSKVHSDFPHHSPSPPFTLAPPGRYGGMMSGVRVLQGSTRASCGTSKVHSDFPHHSPSPPFTLAPPGRYGGMNEWRVCVRCRAVLELAVERAKSTRTFHITRASCPRFTGASRHADSALRSPYSDDDVTAV